MELVILGSVVRQALNAIVITDADLDTGPHIVMANPAFCAMTGYEEHELLGKSPKVLQGPLTDRTVVREMADALRQGDTFIGSTINYRKNGEPYWVEWTITPVTDASGTITHFVSIQQNVNARVEADRQRDILVQALHVAGEAIMITDSMHRIVHINDSFTRLTGYSMPEVDGQLPDLLYPTEPSRNLPKETREQLATGESVRVRMVMRTKDDRELFVDHSIVPVSDPSGIEQHFVTVLTDVSDLISQRDRLHELATTDMLTGALNRHAGDIALSNAHDKLTRNDTSYALILCDIDHFKQINDTHGHNAGDRVLAAVGEKLRTAVRSTDSVIRWGGEEFLIVLPEAPLKAALDLAERLRAAVSDCRTQGVTGVTASFGVGVAWQGESTDQVIERIDEALYRAKHGGRNRVEAAK